MSLTSRKILVFIHRWVELLMAAFLFVEGLSGSLLAFNQDLERLINPEIFAKVPSVAAKQLDLATLADLAEAAEPKIRVGYFSVSEDQAFMHVSPREDPLTGNSYTDVDFNQLFLDPWTGKELGHRRWAAISQGKINLMPFIYEIHQNLSFGQTGGLILGIVAILWTVDNFYAVYLTFPVGWSRFFSRWKTAWKIKWSASVFRVNFDLHRASSLWFLPLLLIFAWSSVMFNYTDVYDWVTGKLFDYQSIEEDFGLILSTPPNNSPQLDWHQGLAAGEQHMREIAKQQGFSIEKTIGLAYVAQPGVYSLTFESNRNISAGGWGGVGVWVDGNTGELKKSFMPDGEHTGNTITNWLRALHFADLHGWLAYRILVCSLGLVIMLLSITGIYIWLKKRSTRQLAHQKRQRIA